MFHRVQTSRIDNLNNLPRIDPSITLSTKSYDIRRTISMNFSELGNIARYDIRRTISTNFSELGNIARLRRQVDQMSMNEENFIDLSMNSKKISNVCLSWWNQVLRKYLAIKGPSFL